MDPAWSKIMQLYPEPQPSGDHRERDRRTIIITTPKAPRDSEQGDVRVDYNFESHQHSLFGSLSWSDTSKSDGAPLPAALDDTGFNGAGEVDLSRKAQISYTHVWNSNMVSETPRGFSRLVTSRIGANPDRPCLQQFGIGGYDPTGATANNGGLPQTGFATAIRPYGATDWVRRRSTTSLGL